MARATDPDRARAAATKILRTLRDHGHTAYFAGGCVRDELLGQRPTDYDIATDAPPERISKLFHRTAHVGAAFGVVLVIQDEVPVEVATFRSEGAYSDFRRPDQVHFSDAQSDAKRRDFTINAIFLDPLAPPEQQVIDYVGGQEDIRRGIVRAVGVPERRLSEDHLRALRAVRFAARLGFEIDPATAAAISRHAVDLKGVSRERIGEELRRMLAHQSRDKAAALIQALSLDAPVLNEPHSDPPLPTLAALPADSPPTTALAAWALDRDGEEQDHRPIVARWRQALMLSNEERDELSDLLEGYSRLRGEFESAGVARQRRIAAERWLNEAVELLRGRPGPDPDLPRRVLMRVAELGATPPGIGPPPLVTGDDLTALGLTPGPLFKGMLEALYDAQLEGRVRTREEAMELARGMRV